MMHRRAGKVVDRRARGDRSGRRRLLFAVLLALTLARCSAPSERPTVPDTPERFVDRVIEDVTAMVEGMVRAHTGQQAVSVAPGTRSDAPRR